MAERKLAEMAAFTGVCVAKRRAVWEVLIGREGIVVE
jgi:hypothetical protein